jgi:hypothetical protein
MPKYPISEGDRKRLDNDYLYHAPKTDQPERYLEIRIAAKKLAICIFENCPVSRERSLALTKIDEAAMMANSSIARNE